MKTNISCPADHVKISGNRVRLTALQVMLTSIAFCITGSWGIVFFLTVDFFMRSFGFGAYSPFNLISTGLERVLSLKPRWVDRAPKAFAAQIGFFLSDCLLIACIFELTWPSFAIAGLLILFSFLEAAIGFCAGCHIYTLLGSWRDRATNVGPQKAGL